MNDENRVFEVDLIVRAAGQPDARVSREYVSANKASTDGAAGEIFVGRSRKRRWALPIIGLAIGIGMVGLLQVYREQPLTAKTVAGCILAGVIAFGLAALSNDQSRSAEQGGGRGP
jgi:hypothetical protein